LYIKTNKKKSKESEKNHHQTPKPQVYSWVRGLLLRCEVKT